jgi:deoxyribodipyrimidine photo-lyase
VAVGTAHAVPPGTVWTGGGTPYRVFTPFRRAWLGRGWPPPQPAPRVRWRRAVSDAAPADLPSRCGRVVPAWWDGLPAGAPPSLPAPGEEAAHLLLDRFVRHAVTDYAEHRDRPDEEGTSRLSPYLRFGCVHPRQVLAALEAAGGATNGGPAVFRSELAWREFYADVLLHQPRSAVESLQPSLAALEWDTGTEAEARFRRWALGRSGYPMVDAAMRQLLEEGWVHNRARMVAASFLVKDLHLHWRWGARWFMYRLVDGDLASNQHGWQWTAGTGTDAAPFNRIYNPLTQGRRFDPRGDYARRYVPELSAGAGGAVHRDGTEPGPLLADAGGYPPAMVDHAAEREEALRRFAAARTVYRARRGRS